MSFDAYSPGSSNSSSTKKEVDYESLNNYVVDQAQLQERETLVGVIAGIVDLGTQEQEDAEVVFKGDEDDEAAEIEKNPDTYFKDGFDQQSRKPARLKCWPQKPVQAVAIAVDFPDIIVDKGQFFGHSNPLPLRLWLGGSFYMEGRGMVVGRPTPLKVVNIDKEASKPKWSFSPLHLFYKMALACKLIKPGEVFLPNSIDKLVGKAMQFEAQVFFKENKGKQYYTEYIKFVGGLGRNQEAPELEDTFLIQFNKPNEPEALKNLRNHVINTIKCAKNFDGSQIQKELAELYGDDYQESGDSSEDEPQKEEKPAKPAKKDKATKVEPKKAQEAPPEDDGDDDSPF